VLAPVGPDSGPKPAVSGYLVVYTDTENPTNTGDIMYYPHTSYKIYDTHGKFLRRVANHMNSEDENPSRVSLPPGRYTVVGQSETQGNVAVPVLVSALRTTVVNLERRPQPRSTGSVAVNHASSTDSTPHSYENDWWRP
jgi:hypothetical protein